MSYPLHHCPTNCQIIRSWRKTMRNKARLFILLALAPIIIGLAGFDSNVEARHRRYYGGFYGASYGGGYGRFGPCCQAPAPAPVVTCPAPAPVISCPAPAPVSTCPTY